jgi:hypothetical protein
LFLCGGQVHACAAARNLALGHAPNAARLRAAQVRHHVARAAWAFPSDPGASGVAHWAAEALDALPPEDAESTAPRAALLFAEITACVHAQHEEEKEEGRRRKEEEAMRRAEGE